MEPLINMFKVKSFKGVQTILLLFALSGVFSPQIAQARVENGGSIGSSESTEPSIFNKDLSSIQWYSSLFGSKNSSKYNSTIALITDGVDESFPDFKGRILPGYDISQKKSIKPGQYSGFGKGGYYGTALASLIISNENNSYLTGISRNATILPISLGNTITDQQVGDAIMYAVKKKVDYIVLALGIDQYLIEGKAIKSCQAISKARSSNILSFVDVYNSGALFDYSYKFGDCEKAIKVGSYDQSFTQFKELSPESQPDFSMPAGNLAAIYSNGSYLPFTLLDDTLASPALAAGLFSNLTPSKDYSKEKILQDLLSSALSLGSPSYFGKGALRNPKIKQNISNFKENFAKSYAPKIVSITRDADTYSLTWEPAINKPLYYLVKSYKFINNTWVAREDKVDSSEVRALIRNFDIFYNAFTQVVAVYNGYAIASLPSFDANNTVKQPVHTLPSDKAAVTSSEVKWGSEGIEVSVVRNDSTYSWDLLLIDPYSGDILKKYSTSSTDSRKISIDQSSPLRSKVLLVATGIGRNGVDFILMPDYKLTLKVNAAGKDYVAFTGTRTCQDLGSVKCDNSTLAEGTTIIITDTLTNKELGRTKIASDGSYAILVPYADKNYSVIARSVLGAKSILSDGSIFMR